MKLIKYFQVTFNSFLAQLKSEKSFARNFTFMFSSKALVIGLSLLTTPILSRIYPPESYGLFAVFNAIVLNFTTLSSLSYSEALKVAKDDKSYYSLFWVCIMLFSLNLLIIVFSLDLILSIFKPEERFHLAFKVMIIIGCIISGFSNIISKWNIIRNNFEFAAFESSINSVLSKVISIGIGLYLNYRNLGLVMIDIISKSSTILIYSRTYLYKEHKRILAHAKSASIITTVKAYLPYPKFILPSLFLDMIAGQLPIILLFRGFGSDLVGQYSMAISMINLPLLLIGNSISPILIPKLHDLHKGLYKSKILEKSFFAFFLLLIGPILTLIFFGSQIFQFVFGGSWSLSGAFCGILSIYLIYELMKYCFASVYQIYNRQHFVLIFNVIKMMIIFIGILPGYIYHNAILMIVGYSTSKLICDYYYILEAYKILNSSGRCWYNLASLSIIVGLPVLIFYRFF